MSFEIFFGDKVKIDVSKLAEVYNFFAEQFLKHSTKSIRTV